MKNLANCTPKEFIQQTCRIKKSVQNWLKVTDLMTIRKNLPKLEEPSADATVEERARIYAENKEKSMEQARKNAALIFDAVFEDHPDETLEVLALCCFIEPKDVNKHPVSDYLKAATEMMNDEAVVGFFTSLARLGLLNI